MKKINARVGEVGRLIPPLTSATLALHKTKPHAGNVGECHTRMKSKPMSIIQGLWIHRKWCVFCATIYGHNTRYNKMNLAEMLTRKNNFTYADKQLAVLLGRNEAEVLTQVYELSNNPRTQKYHADEQRHGITNTWRSWQKHIFPFMSMSTMRRAFNNLRKEGYIDWIAEYHDDTKAIKTQWFFVNIEALHEIGESESVELTPVQNEQTPVQNEQTVCSKRTDPLFKMNRPSVQNEHPLKNIKESQNESSNPITSQASLRTNAGMIDDLIGEPMDELPAPRDENSAVTIWQQVTGQLVTPHVMRELDELANIYDADVIRDAIVTTTENATRPNIAYLRKVLQSKAQEAAKPRPKAYTSKTIGDRPLEFIPWEEPDYVKEWRTKNGSGE